MHDSQFLVELLLLVALAALGVAVFERLRLPSIVGFLAMGALVGPGGLGLVDDPDRVSALAELGVVFLLFEIGLELPMERVRRLWRRALAAGGLQVLITLVCVAGVAMALGTSLPSSLVMGALVAMSSTALVLGLMAERGEIDAPQGQLTLGILLFQDLCIVPFLLAVPLLAAVGTSDPTGVLLSVGGAALALGVVFVATRMVLPELLERAARRRSRELFTLLAFVVVLGSAVLAEKLGLTLAVGAFLGGLALSASPYANQLFAEVMPLRGVLLGLFFTAVGMLLDLGEAGDRWFGILVYVGAVVLLKALVVAAIVALALRQGMRLGTLTGMALAQTGEFSFVLAAAASAAGLLDGDLLQVFIGGSVLTLAATPFLIAASPRVANAVAHWMPAREPELEVEGEDTERLEGHVIVIGYGVAGKTLARVLRSRATPYLVIDSNPGSVQAARKLGERIVYGDATRSRLLERLGLLRARLVIVCISDPLATRDVVKVVHRMAPELDVVARTRYVLEVDELEASGADAVIAEEYEATLELLSETLRRFGVPDESVARFAAGLREEGYELLRAPAGLILDPWATELLEEVSTEWVDVPVGIHAGATLASLDVRARTEVNVVALERDGVARSNPSPHEALQAGDRLLALGRGESIEALRELLERLGGSSERPLEP